MFLSFSSQIYQYGLNFSLFYIENNSSNEINTWLSILFNWNNLIFAPVLAIPC